MFSFKLGAMLKEKEALDTFKSELGEFNFPQTLKIENLMPFALVHSPLNVFISGHLSSTGNCVAEVTFPTFGHLVQFANDVETVAKLNNYQSAVIISSVSTNAPTSETPETHKKRTKKGA